MQKDANLVELEKCCQTHIFLQNLGLIQPRTSPPKYFAKILQKLPILLTLTPNHTLGSGRTCAAVQLGSPAGRAGKGATSTSPGRARANRTATPPSSPARTAPSCWNRGARTSPRGDAPGCCIARDRANLAGLVLGRIEAKFCEKICV